MGIVAACIYCTDWLLQARANPEARARGFFKLRPRITPLLLALDYRRISIVKQLLQARADVNRMTSATPLLASIDAVLPETSSESQKQETLVRILINARADVNQRGPVGIFSCGPLQVAVRRCHSTEIVKLLLQGGANLSMSCNDGRTALHLAREFCPQLEPELS